MSTHRPKRGLSPNSLKTLKKHAFPPGVSGNPGGRAKGVTVSQAMKTLLSEYMRKGGKITTKQNATAVAEVLLKIILGQIKAAPPTRVSAIGRAHEISEGVKIHLAGGLVNTDLSGLSLPELLAKRREVLDAIAKDGAEDER